jgi:hypothetical protein
LLHGHLPQEWHGKNDLLREFLTSFMIPDRVKYCAPIPSSITPDDVAYGFSKWKESTSTSPSGRHLGHYKAIIQDATLLSCLTKFMAIITKRGLVLSRWCNTVNIMIEKEAGNPLISRLRIIHLFEADLNLF